MDVDYVYLIISLLFLHLKLRLKSGVENYLLPTTLVGEEKLSAMIEVFNTFCYYQISAFINKTGGDKWIEL